MSVSKIKTLLESCILINGVSYLSIDIPIDEELEQLYLKVRAKEGRLYDDSTVSSLPDISKNDAHYEQWQVRKNSAHKFIDYLTRVGGNNIILELGCGNGWFSNLLASRNGTYVIGLDINRKELEQATRVFKRDNLRFVYGDIYDEKFSGVCFDIIVLNASVQYFPDVDKLFGTMLNMLEPNGEIHILDTPLYTKANVGEKTMVTEVYYDSIGFPEMAKYYHHHLLDAFSKYKPELIYKPGGFINRLKNLFLNDHNSPFPWVRIRKADR